MPTVDLRPQWLSQPDEFPQLSELGLVIEPDFAFLAPYTPVRGNFSDPLVPLSANSAGGNTDAIGVGTLGALRGSLTTPVNVIPSMRATRWTEIGALFIDSGTTGVYMLSARSGGQAVAFDVTNSRIDLVMWAVIDVYITGVTIPIGEPIYYVAKRDGSLHEFWMNGSYCGSASNSSTPGAIVETYAVGDTTGSGVAGRVPITGRTSIHSIVRTPAALSSELCQELSQPAGPWKLFEPQRIWVPVSTSGGSSTVAIGVVSETDATLAFQSLQAAALGLAQETDSALPITGLNTLAIGQLSETDSALSIAAAQAGTLGLATETDAALGMAGGTAQALGLATETDAALALAAAQATQLGQVTEVDTALALAAAQQATLGLATETDTALDVAVMAPGAIGIASEADEALPLAGAQVAALGQAQETDAALQLSPLQATVLGLVLEIDAGLAITMQQAGALGLPVETDDAIALAAGADEPTPIAERTWQIPVDVRVWTMPRT
jgi:hypothetical protein